MGVIEEDVPQPGINEVEGEHRRAKREEVSLVARVRPVPSTIDMAWRSPPLGVAIMDISVLGLSFLTNEHFDQEDVVEVDLSWGGATISLHGVVKHVHTKATLSTVGIQYLITASTKHAIANLSHWLQTFSDAPILPI